MSEQPKELSGTDPFVRAFNILVRFAKQNRVIESPTVKPQPGSMGTILNLVVPAAAGGSPASVAVIRVSIKSIFDNYFVCLDSTGKTFRVAKCPELQNSVGGRNYYGVNWAYGYPRNSTVNTYRYILRVASATVGGVAVTETQLICEPYVVGATFGAGTMLSAIKTPTGVATIAADTGATVGTSVDYQDMNISAHAWCRAANQNPT